ncbi:hypothetical protein [Sphingomonas sp. NPDC079357]|uniref:hypothetical protein n=1 Tax=Sphingomonas sp. NPDC079357 TaxID=3364518 RepID=UPI00384BC6A0
MHRNIVAVMRETDKSEAIVSRTLSVAGLYASGTFTVGFLLGTARELAVAPALGTTTALVVELPIMIAASVGIGRWCLRRERPRFAAAERLAMGAVSLILLLLMEDLLTRALRGTSLSEQWASQTEARLALTIAGLLAFAIAPLIIGARGRADRVISGQ